MCYDGTEWNGTEKKARVQRRFEQQWYWLIRCVVDAIHRVIKPRDFCQRGVNGEGRDPGRGKVWNVPAGIGFEDVERAKRGKCC